MMGGQIVARCDNHRNGVGELAELVPRLQAANQNPHSQPLPLDLAGICHFDNVNDDSRRAEAEISSSDTADR